MGCNYYEKIVLYDFTNKVVIEELESRRNYEDFIDKNTIQEYDFEKHSGEFGYNLEDYEKEYTDYVTEIVKSNEKSSESQKAIQKLEKELEELKESLENLLKYNDEKIRVAIRSLSDTIVEKESLLVYKKSVISSFSSARKIPTKIGIAYLEIER